MIRRDSDIIIEVSTGGVSDLNIRERCAPLYSELVEACSLNVGSTNLGKAVYCNPIDDVEYCIREILKQKKTPEVETFEIGHTWTMARLMRSMTSRIRFCSVWCWAMREKPRQRPRPWLP